MKTISYWILVATTFLRKFRKILFASVVIGILLFVLYSKLHGFLSFFERGEVIGVVDTLSLEKLPIYIQNDISMGLTRIDEEGEAQHAISTSWRAEEDGKVWIFNLGNYKWQDGTQVSASDIQYKFGDEGVKQEILDKKTIKFILKDPFAPFPTVVSKPILKKGLVGVGDWKVTKLTKLNAQFTKSLRLINVNTGSIRTYKFYPTQEAVRVAFKLGEVDKVLDLTEVKDLSSWKNVQIDQNLREDRYVGIFINTKDSLLSDKSIRQALAYAINKAQLGEKRAISPISPTSWAFNPQVKEYQYSPERAKELLESVKKERKEDSGKKYDVSLVTIPGLLSVADKIKEDWEAVGVTTHILVSNIQPDSFQAFLAIDEVPPDPDQYARWHSSQPSTTNLTRYNSEQKASRMIDKLLEDGRRTLDKEERKKIYLDFQRFLLEDLPVIPLFHPPLYTISRK